MCLFVFDNILFNELNYATQIFTAAPEIYAVCIHNPAPNPNPIALITAITLKAEYAGKSVLNALY